MKRIYLLAYITILSLSASESAAWPDAVYSGAAERPFACTSLEQ